MILQGQQLSIHPSIIVFIRFNSAAGDLINL